MEQATSYTDINEILEEVLTGAQAILGDGFVGMYLDGSLAAGDFAYETSDIDFVVATAISPSPKQMDELVRMHGRVASIATIKMDDNKMTQQLRQRYRVVAVSELKE